MTARKPIFAAICVIVALAAALYAAIFASSGLPGTPTTYVEASFDNVGGLREGDDVRQSSVRVGRVDKIRVEDDHAVVRLQLTGDHAVYSDASAAIWARSSLGQNFVELNPGHEIAGSLGDGAIPRTRTVPPSQLDTLLSVLDKPTRDALGSTLREAGGGVEGHSQHLADFLENAPDLLADLGSVSGALSSDEAALPELLQATGELSQRFRGHEDDVASLIARLDDTLAAVGTDDAVPLRNTLAQAPTALAEARAGLSALQAPLTDLDVAARTLQPGARALGAATPDLRAVLRDARGPLAKVPGVAELADPALVSLTGALTDARPLSERLEYTFAATDGPAAYLAPYAFDINQFFDYWHSANGSSDVSGHFLRLGFVVKPESIDGAIPLRDPLVHRNPYPAPGQAQRDRPTSLLGGNR